MTLTRPQRVRQRARVTVSRVWDEISDDIPLSLHKKVRARLEHHIRAQGEHAIDTYTVPTDTEGFLILLKTDNEEQENIFRVIATVHPDYRLRMSDREIPVDSIVEVARFPVLKVRTARRMVLDALDARPSLRKIHAEWYIGDGGAQTVRFMISNIARRVNGQPPIIRVRQSAPAPRVRTRINLGSPVRA